MARITQARAPKTSKIVVHAFEQGKIERRKIDKLKPYPRNPKTHSPEQIDALAKIIQEFGFTRPVLIDEEDMILAGHGATKAGQKLDMDEVPVIVLKGLSDAQKRAVVIADNQASELGGWDKDLLKLELGELQRLNYDLNLTGFSPESLVSYLVVPKPTPPQQFQAFDETLPTEHQCPSCGFKWSGSSEPREEEPAPTRKKAAGARK